MNGDFAPEIERAQQQYPSPAPRIVLLTLLALFGVMLTWACIGRLDIVAVAQGKLVPRSYLKIVQPAEAGIVQDILVREGDVVREGQPLVRMDMRLSTADVNVLKAELGRRRLQLRRIEAELSGVPLQRRADDPDDIFGQVDAQFRARRQVYLDSLGAERAILLKAQHDLKAAGEIEGKLAKVVPIHRDQAEAWAKLAKEGFAGRLLALERQRTFLESEQDLKAQSENVAGLRAQASQSNQRIAQITSNYRQQLQNERVEAEGIYYKLQQDLDKQQHRHSLLELVAPKSGIVKDLATHTSGAVVAPGTILLTLVPSEEPLIAEVWVGNADAGFVQARQKARVKLAAYPFQKFGMIDGIVQQIGADAQEKPEPGAAPAKSMQEATYRTLVSIEDPGPDGRSRKLKLVPGMQVSAEIHLGTRTVLEYLLSPIQKVAHEAGRER
jgi:hemolysin D